MHALVVVLEENRLEYSVEKKLIEIIIVLSAEIRNRLEPLYNRVMRSSVVR